jgi:spermidine synthase
MTAAVLGIFLGGLAIGYTLFGHVSNRLVAQARLRERPPPLLLAYGIIEASIGVYALAFPFLFRGVQALSLYLPHFPSGIAFAIDVILCVLLIGPPTILMGATIPLLTQALARGVADATRFHALVYGLNTAGGLRGGVGGGLLDAGGPRPCRHARRYGGH